MQLLRHELAGKCVGIWSISSHLRLGSTVNPASSALEGREKGSVLCIAHAVLAAGLTAPDVYWNKGCDLLRIDCIPDTLLSVLLRDFFLSFEDFQRLLQTGFVASFVSKFSDTISSEIGKVGCLICTPQ